MIAGIPTRPLAQIARTIDYGVTASASHDVAGKKFLRITDIQDGSVDWASVPYCVAPESKLRSACLTDGDIVFARTGATTGKSFLIKSPPDGAVFASYLIRLKPSTEVEPAYLAHFFQSAGYWAQIRKKTQGAAQGGVNASSLRELEIPLPPLDDQRRIAAILDKADALRRKRKRALELLDGLTQSIFQEMFQGAEGRYCELKDAVKPGTIITYGIVQAGPEVPGGVPYIRTGDIVGGEIRQADLRRTAPEIAAKFGRSRVDAGDIVMSIRATVGTTAVVPKALAGANLTQGTARIAPGNEVTLEYMLSYLRSQTTQRWISAQVKGATFLEITLGRLRELPFFIPPMERQIEFSRRVAKTNLPLTLAREHYDHLSRLFSSLQHRAFAGEL